MFFFKDGQRADQALPLGRGICYHHDLLPRSTYYVQSCTYKSQPGLGGTCYRKALKTRHRATEYVHDHARQTLCNNIQVYETILYMYLTVNPCRAARRRTGTICRLECDYSSSGEFAFQKAPGYTAGTFNLICSKFRLASRACREVRGATRRRLDRQMGRNTSEPRRLGLET